MNEGFAAIVTVKLKPEMIDHYLTIAAEVGDAMRREKEFKHAWVHRLADDENTIIVYEAWACTYDHFMKELWNKPYRGRFEAEIGDMAFEQRKIEILNYALSYPD